MTLIYYCIILFIILTLLYFLLKRNKIEEIIRIIPFPSNYKWSIIIKQKGRFYKYGESDDLGKIGYQIYTELIKPDKPYEIYIRNNQQNELMKIDGNSDTESMIGVNHPQYGHIGYLPFTLVTSN